MIWNRCASSVLSGILKLRFKGIWQSRITKIKEVNTLACTLAYLHYYLNLMREVRAALDAGRFGAFVAQFHADRARGV